MTTTTFEDLVKSILTVIDMEAAPNKFQSKNRYTRLLENPDRATNHELLIWSDLLGLTPWQLYQQYGVGSSSITDREAQQHLLMHNLNKPSNHDNNNQPQPFAVAPAPA